MCEIADWVILILLTLCAVHDWKKREIPLVLLVIMSIGVSVFVICCHTEPLLSRGIGAFLGIGFFLVSKCTKEAVGYGDSWLILLIGIYLGGLRALQVLFLASVAAGIGSLFCLWKNHWNRNVTIPFVPFMAVAYLGVIVT